MDEKLNMLLELLGVKSKNELLFLSSLLLNKALEQKSAPAKKKAGRPKKKAGRPRKKPGRPKKVKDGLAE